MQGRFRHLFEPKNRHIIDEIQAEVDRKWAELLANEDAAKEAAVG